MRWQGETSRMWCSVVVTGLTAVTGCVGSEAGLPASLLGGLAAVPFESLIPHVIVGASDQRVLIGRTMLSAEFEGLSFGMAAPFFGPPAPPGALDDGGFDPGLDPPPPTMQVVSVDLNSMETQVLVDDAPGDVFGMRGDGQWLVWPDLTENVLRVMNLDADSEPRGIDSAYLDGAANILAVSGGRMLAAAWGEDHHFLVLYDLTTGEETLLDNYVSRGAALNGDTLAAFREEPDVEQGSGGEPSSARRIELLDLASGEVLVTINDPSIGGAGHLYLTDEQVFWTVYGYDHSSRSVTLFAYDLNAGFSEQIAEITSTTNVGSTSIVDIGPAGVLLDSRFGTELDADNSLAALLRMKTTQSYILMSLDGRTRTLFEFSYGVFEPPLYMIEPVLLAESVLFRHPLDGEYVLLNLDSGAEQRFDPFAGLE